MQRIVRNAEMLFILPDMSNLDSIEELVANLYGWLVTHSYLKRSLEQSMETTEKFFKEVFDML